MPSLQQNLLQAASALDHAGILSARLTAEVMLAHLIQRERVYLYAHPEEDLPPDLEARLGAWVQQRAGGVPLQYLVGKQEFYGRPFQVRPGVLIPRPETELVVEVALALLPGESGARVVDVGAGSGCIAVTLALERPRVWVIATDVSVEALALARANAVHLGAAVDFVACDLLSAVSGELDLVISNPPYLAESELPELQPEVRRHEPAIALVAGPVGTEIYARLIPQVHARLRPGGWLVLELGFASADAVRALLHPDRGRPWSDVSTRRDLQGWERVLTARKC